MLLLTVESLSVRLGVEDEDSALPADEGAAPSVFLPLPACCCGCFLMALRSLVFLAPSAADEEAW